jgi:tRNA pseudouridine38-40 synthase
VGIPAEKWARTLNDLLDEDIAVQSAAIVSERFHSRFSARSRTYRYRITSGTRNPLRDRWSCWDWREPDVEPMRFAAQALIGRHDYRAYTAELQPWLTNSFRELLRIEIDERRNGIEIVIEGTAFMRGMMRRIAGGLFEVGIGKRDPDDLRRLLTEAGMATIHLPVVLPAKGLTLLKVNYGRKLRDLRTEDEIDE